MCMYVCVCVFRLLSQSLKAMLASPNVDVSIRDRNGFTCLHHAAAVANTLATREILYHGADPRAKVRIIIIIIINHQSSSSFEVGSSILRIHPLLCCCCCSASSSEPGGYNAVAFGSTFRRCELCTCPSQQRRSCRGTYTRFVQRERECVCVGC